MMIMMMMMMMVMMIFQVHLQTQQEVKMRMVGMAMHVVKNDGVLALYNGLSASLCRQVSVTLDSGKRISVCR